jgi:hypothetical protein
MVGLAVGETALLTAADVRELARNLPSRCVGKSWKLLFSTSQHGYSLATLYNRTRGMGPTVLVVMDEQSHIFGGFASRDWSGSDISSSSMQQFAFSSLTRAGQAAAASATGAGRTTQYFGTGEAFLFRLKPGPSAIWRWSRKNSEFQLARREMLALGGGGGKFGLCLDASLDRGWSGPCDTFDNAPLAGREMFRAVRVEVWGFVLPHGLSAAAGGVDALSAAGSPTPKMSISALSGGSGGVSRTELANGPSAWISSRAL